MAEKKIAPPSGEGRPSSVANGRLLASLRGDEPHFRRIVETALTGILVADPDFRSVYVNPTLCDMLGRPAGEIIGRPLADFIHPRDLEDNELRKARRIEGISERYERRLLRSGGETVWVQISAAPLMDESGRFQGSFVTIADLTGHKDLERRLIREVRRSAALEEMARLSLVAKSVDEAARLALRIALRFTNSPEGYAGYIDPATGHLICPPLNGEEEEIRGGPAVFSSFEGLWGRVLATKEPLLDNALQGADQGKAHPLGRPKAQRVLSVPALHGQELAGQIAVFNASADYTMEDRLFLERLASLLALSVRRRLAEEALIRAKDKAEEANEAKSAFLATISHELRTPLNGTLGMLQLLQSTSLNEEQRDFLNIALDTSRHLTQLIADILDITMIESQSLALLETNFDLELALAPLLDSCARQAAQKGIAFSHGFSGDLPSPLRGDEGRIRQVLFNLLSNALKFTREGAVRLDVEMAAGPRPEQRWIIFTVADTGIGLPEERVESLFEPFTQLDGSRTRAFGGVGLGLTLVRRLVEFMQGAIVVESTPGLGSVFSCSILAGAPEGPPAETPPSWTGPQEAKSIRILLVEDDIINRLATENLLKTLTRRVLTAEHGRAALELLRRECVDVILMDLRMPVMDGLTATRIIRTDPAFAPWSRIPIVALTAHALSEDQAACEKAGMNAFLAKPFDLVTLAQALSRAMNMPLALPLPQT